MTTAHTQPAGCDLDSLTRYAPTDQSRNYADFPEGPMSTSKFGQYFKVDDVERLFAARAAQAPQGDQSAIAHSIGHLSPAIAQAPQGDTRQGAHTCTPADERMLFEAWAPGNVTSLIQGKFGTGYVYADTVSAWKAWQARAAQGAGTASVGQTWTGEAIADACVKAGLGILECHGLLTVLKDTHPAPVSTAVPSQRGAFEAWVAREHPTIRLVWDEASGNYVGLWSQDAWGAWQAATVSTAAAPELTVRLTEMRESNGNVTWNVLLVKAGDSLMNGHSVYTDRIKGRAKYEADSLRHFLGQGPYPDILAYDTDLPIAEVSTAAATTASASEVEGYGYMNEDCDAPMANGACSECGFGPCHRAAAGQQGASRAALSDWLNQAADMLQTYHAYLMQLSPINFDEHPYLPSIEETAEELRAFARAPLPAQADGQGGAA